LPSYPLYKNKNSETGKIRWNLFYEDLKTSSKQDTDLDATMMLRYNYWGVWKIWERDDNEAGLKKLVEFMSWKKGYWEKVCCPQVPQGQTKSGYTVPQSHNHKVGRKRGMQRKDWA